MSDNDNASATRARHKRGGHIDPSTPGKPAKRPDRTDAPASDHPVEPAATDATAATDEESRKAGRKEAAAKRRRSGERRKRLNESLILELRALRQALTQAAEAFELRTGGQIAEMLQTLEGDDALDQRPRRLTVAEAQAALDQLAARTVSSKAGRLRELRRIRAVVRRVRRIVGS